MSLGAYDGVRCAACNMLGLRLLRSQSRIQHGINRTIMVIWNQVELIRWQKREPAGQKSCVLRGGWAKVRVLCTLKGGSKVQLSAPGIRISTAAARGILAGNAGFPAAN